MGPLIPMDPRRPGGPWMCENVSLVYFIEECLMRVCCYIVRLCLLDVLVQHFHSSKYLLFMYFFCLFFNLRPWCNYVLVGSILIPFLLEIGDKITQKIQCILNSNWSSDIIRTGMPWCPGTPFSPGSPRWPWWRRHALNLKSLWNHLLLEAQILSIS